MTEDEQNIAIHIARGLCRSEDIFDVIGRGLVYSVKTERGWEERKVPNYLNDLNAMADAEKTMNRGQRSYFRLYLGSMFPKDEDGDTTGWEGKFGRAIHATAAQRAECFLRVLDLWKESK